MGDLLTPPRKAWASERPRHATKGSARGYVWCACPDRPRSGHGIPLGRSLEWRMAMSKERIEGVTQKGVGAIKQTVGKAIGNEQMQAEGAADKIIGSAKEAAGKVIDAVHKATR